MTDQDICSECGSKLADGECFVCDESDDSDKKSVGSKRTKSDESVDSEPTKLEPAALPENLEDAIVSLSQARNRNEWRKVSAALNDLDRVKEDVENNWLRDEDIIQLLKERYVFYIGLESDQDTYLKASMCDELLEAIRGNPITQEEICEIRSQEVESE